MIKLPDLASIESAADLVYRSMQPSPKLSWPLLNERAGCEIWVKHENHNPTGAFKVRGGLVYINQLLDTEPGCSGICAATRGNHGQSVAFAASARGVPSVVVVPEGNSPDKNAAMKAFGAELVIHGRDFDVALEHARALADERNLHFMPSLDAGLIPGVVAAKRALGLSTEIIGVVSSEANTYALSFAAGEPVPTNSADTLADGLAVRNPSPVFRQTSRSGADRWQHQ